MSRMLLAPPPTRPHARDAAAAEVALALGRPWLAEMLAHRALAAQPNDARALGVLAGLGATPDDVAANAGAAATAVSHRVATAYREAVGRDLSHDEARIAIEGLLRHGHARARPSRRHRGESLPPGARIVVHHRRPDIAIIVRRGRPIGVRRDGRTVVASPGTGSRA